MEFKIHLRHRAVLLASALLLFGIIFSAIYSLRSYPDVVWQDGMFILDLIKHPSTELGFWFPVFGEHLLPVWLLQVRASQMLLNLDMRTDCFVFVLSNAIVYSTAMYSLRNVLARMQWLPFLVTGMLLCTFSFSLVQPPLTCMSAQFSLGSAIGFVIAALTIELGNRHGLGLRLLYVIAIIAYFLCCGGYFPGLIIGMIGLIGAMALSGRHDRKFLLSHMAPVLIGTCCYLALLHHLKAGAPTTASTGVLARALDLPDTLMWILTAIGGSVLDIHTIHDRNWPIEILPLIGLGLALAAGAMVIICHIAKNIPPLAIYGLLYPIGIVAAVHAGRGGEGVGYDWMVNEWYSFHFKFFLIGMLVMAVEQYIVAGLRQTSTIIFAIALAIALPLMAISTVSQWRRGPFIHAWLMEKREALRLPPSEDRAKILCWDRSTIDRVIPFLRERRLSSFRDLTFGDLPAVQVTSGWYTDGWMGPQAQAEINMPEATRLQLRLWTPPELGDGSMAIVINGNTGPIVPLQPSTESVTTFDVPAGHSELIFKASGFFVPKTLGTNLDSRSLSVIGSLHHQVLTQVYPVPLAP